MNDLDEPFAPGCRDDLSEEQSALDLEQTAGEREQLINDDDQARIDEEQAAVDHDRLTALADDQPAARVLDARQSHLDRAQFRVVVRQDASDLLQIGRDDQQEALDDARTMLDHPVADRPSNGPGLDRDADERAVAVMDRAEAGVVRSEATRVRVAGAELRARGAGQLLGSTSGWGTRFSPGDRPAAGGFKPFEVSSCPRPPGPSPRVALLSTRARTGIA